MVEKITLAQLKTRPKDTTPIIGDNNFNGDKKWLVEEVKRRINMEPNVVVLNNLITTSKDANIKNWETRIKNEPQKTGKGGRQRTYPTIIGYANEVIDFLNGRLTSLQAIANALAMPQANAGEITAKLTALQNIANTYPTGTAPQQAAWNAGTNNVDVPAAIAKLQVLVNQQRESDRLRNTKTAALSSVQALMDDTSNNQTKLTDEEVKTQLNKTDPNLII